MERALPRPTWIAWSRLAGLAVGLSLYLALNWYFIQGIDWGQQHTDWQLFSTLPATMADGALYDQSRYPEQPWVWSPLFAPFMVGVTWLGYWPWIAVKVASLALLWRRPRLIALVLGSYAFYADLSSSGVFTPIFVAGALALTGSRLAAYVYLAMFLLVPRPVQLPLVLYLLWQMPDLRRPFAIGAAIYGLGVLASGYTIEWVTSMLDRTNGYNFYGPTYVFGKLWLLVGVPLAAWLTWRGRPGLAGWLVAPYMVQTYWLMPLIDLRLRDPEPVTGQLVVGHEVLRVADQHQSDGRRLGNAGDLSEPCIAHPIH